MPKRSLFRTRSQVLKIRTLLETVPHPHILCPLGPPHKRVNFAINHKNAYFVYCTWLSRTYLIDIPLATYWIIFPLLCLVPSALWLPQLSKLQSFLVHYQLCGPPLMGAVGFHVGFYSKYQAYLACSSKSLEIGETTKSWIYHVLYLITNELKQNKVLSYSVFHFIWVFGVIRIFQSYT